MSSGAQFKVKQIENSAERKKNLVQRRRRQERRPAEKRVKSQAIMLAQRIQRI